MIEPRPELKNINIYEIASYPENWDMKLDSNENYIGPSVKVMEALKNLDTSDISQYPYYGKLYDALCEVNCVNNSNIVITNGADEALSAVLNTFVSKGEAILTAKPSFSMPKIYAQMIGANYIEIPYTKKWEYPFEQIVNSIDSSVKAILLTTPNNPTGDVIPVEQVKSILASNPDKLVIIDETYTNYAGLTNVGLTEEFDNAVVVKSMSKDYGLAGLRIGYIVSQKENIDNIKKILSPYNVNVAAAAAAHAALKDTAYLEYVKNEIRTSKVFLTEELTKLGIKVYDSFANFILADFSVKKDFVFDKLKSHNIVVKSFTKREEMKDCLRITVPTLSAAKKLVALLQPKDTLVFDMDGVLIDVSRSYFEAIRHTYSHFTGNDLSTEAIHSARKQGGLNNDWDLTSYLIKQSGLDFSYDEIVDVFQKQYWNDGNGSINNEELLIEESLLEDVSRKYNMAIFTGRPKDEAIYTLEKFGIKKYFEKIITMDDVALNEQKPHTSGLKQISAYFMSDKFIYFGDTVDDAKCANDFGAYGVGILPPSDKCEELKNILLEKGDKAVLNSINDLKSILEKINHEKEHNYQKN